MKRGKEERTKLESMVASSIDDEVRRWKEVGEKSTVAAVGEYEVRQNKINKQIIN